MINIVRLIIWFIYFTSVVDLKAQNPPSWVDNMPVDDEYYIATTSVEIRKLSNQDYKLRANEQAFRQISMQIKATVSEISKSFTSEKTFNDRETIIDELVSLIDELLEE